MTRTRFNSFFASACVSLTFVVSGCGGVGLPDATDEYYAGEAEAAAAVLPTEAPESDAPADEQEAPPATETETETEAEDTEAESETEYTSECLFGTSVADMAQADWLEVGTFEHAIGADALVGLEGEQLLEGFASHGAGAVDDIDELFERFVDDGRIMIRTVADAETGEQYTHLAFWSQGREKGYLFLEDTLRLMAAVDGGTIYACVVSY